MTLFLPNDPSDVTKLLEAYPLCWVVSAGRHHEASALPLLPEKGPNGGVKSLLGHMARSNPLQNALERDPRATILCMGPQGYISPELVSNPTWGPTWNYAVCRFETDVRFIPEETDFALSQLATSLEGAAPDSWTPKRMGDRYHQLKRRIIAFRATVVETHPKFKLGQDETDVVFNDIVEGLQDRMLAEWMSRTHG